MGRTNKPCDVSAGTDGGVDTGAEFTGTGSSSDHDKEPVTWGPDRG